MKAFKGFTLIEVLVTIGLILLVLSLAGSSLYFIIRSTTDSRILLYENREIMKVYGQMRQQLLSLYLSPHRNLSIRAIRGESEGQDEIIFLTSAPLYSSGIAQAGYMIKKNEKGEKYLVYSEFPYVLKEDFAPAETRVLSKMVNGLKIRCFENFIPADNWEKAGFPDKIEITLFLADRGKNRFTFTVTPGISSKLW